MAAVSSLINETFGFWGTITATIDWCESNYDISYFVAEFWNTLSNIAIIAPAILGAIRCWQCNIEKRIILAFVLLSFVGLGSWCFHMTLLYEMQLLDEIPMVAVSMVSISSLLSSLQVSCKNSLLVEVLLTLTLVAFTLIYVLVKTPILFQLSYAAMVFGIIYVDLLILKRHPSNKKLLTLGLSLYGCGVVFWLCDNIFCDNLRELRQLLPSFIAPLTQFHSLWHIFAGFGAYIQVLLCLRSHVLSKYKLADVSLKYGFVEIKQLKSYQNGH
ncbi:hypothetical protein B4U80_01135 [Leptotrombidium deliense]|uniref:Alkaline ceramidase n=1 Tax=Leptotrombidium deliense TaxID=299467 RepID=A0A443S989_9ACAR|nr:hypothetical protein B4U80_01135 [Leptotrombidium deliense]